MCVSKSLITEDEDENGTRKRYARGELTPSSSAWAGAEFVTGGGMAGGMLAALFLRGSNLSAGREELSPRQRSSSKVDEVNKSEV